MPEKIFCLMSVDNLYDQPPNNLVAWWSEKPAVEVMATAMGYTQFPTEHDQTDEAIKTIWAGEEVRIRETDWRLVVVPEGLSSCQKGSF